MSYQYHITSRYVYHNDVIVDMFFINGIPFTFDDIPTIMQDDPYIQMEQMIIIPIPPTTCIDGQIISYRRSVIHFFELELQIQRNFPKTKKMTSFLRPVR